MTKVQIEQTSKKTKVARAAGLGLLVVGALIGAATWDGYGPGPGLPTYASGFFFVTGLLVYIGATAWTWWEHG